jgi:hypothetical protein
VDGSSVEEKRVGILFEKEEMASSASASALGRKDSGRNVIMTGWVSIKPVHTQANRNSLTLYPFGFLL